MIDQRITISVCSQNVLIYSIGTKSYRILGGIEHRFAILCPYSGTSCILQLVLKIFARIKIFESNVILPS